jgi:predicted permease
VAPPGLAERLLRVAVSHLGEAGTSVVGDLREEYAAAARGRGVWAARRWYARQVWSLVWRALRDRVRGSGPFHSNPAAAPRVRRGGWSMREAGQDVKYAARSLARVPHYTAAAVLTLALAVAANTLVFSVVDSVLLEPLPYPDSDRLVAVTHAAPGLNYPQIGVSPGLYHQYRERVSAFESSALYRGETMNLTAEGAEPARLEVAAVTHTLFETLRVNPVLGRGFTAEEDAPDGPAAVILSHGLWRDRFGGARAVIGSRVRVDGIEREVVGVMPSGFGFPDRDIALWIPLAIDLPNASPGNFAYASIARLAASATVAAARVQLDGVVARLGEAYPNSGQLVAFLETGRFASTLSPAKETMVGDLRRPLWILLGTVALVLVIACANVTNLFLVRAEARFRDIAVRSALGASRIRLARHFLTETAVLAAISAVAGVLIAVGGAAALLRFAPPNLPRLDEVRLDGTAILFAGGLATAIALLLALIPALRLTSPSALALVSRSGLRTTAGRERSRTRQMLVVLQTALALVLLAGSGLMLRTFAQLRGLDPGFDASSVLTFRVTLPEATYADAARAAAFHERVLVGLRALPGVESAGGVGEVPLGNRLTGTAFEIEGQPIAPNELPPMLFYTVATDGYFDVMRIPVRAGERLQGADREATRRGVLVSQNVADRFWPGQDPLGKRLRAAGNPADWSTVIGVVGNVRDRRLQDEPSLTLYFPTLAGPDGDTIAGNELVARTMTYVVRSPRAEALAGAVRNVVWAIDRDLPIATLTTMRTLVAESMTQISFTMFALVIAAALALFLGAVGLYGVISYMVTQRTREIGLRIALGAEAASVRRMVVWQGLRLAVLGLAAGGAAALGLTRVLGSLLFQTSPNDPFTFAAVIAVLAMVSVFASWLPARRAARVDPARSLQAD